MRQLIKTLLCCSVIALAISSCKRTDYEPAKINADGSLTLKAAAQYMLGVGIDYDSIVANKTYTKFVKEQFDNITAGYTMKHGGMVKSDGSLDFTKSDILMNFAATNGMTVYGHTLVWHQNNNGNYLRALIAKPSSTTSNPNLLPNSSFELGTAGTVSNTGSPYGGIANNWTAQVQGTGAGSISLSSAAGEFNNETRGVKAVVDAVPANGYQFQLFPSGTGAPTLTAGTTYKISFYAKHSGATTPNILVGLESGGWASNNITVTTTWTKYTANLTPSGGDASRFNFQFRQTGTFFIDSVSVTLANPVGGAPSAAELKLRVDTTMKNWITKMVTKYKGKIPAWEVINEPVDDAGKLRTGTSSSDGFYWGNYLGDSIYYKAFKYAHEADPNAKLFLNDYNHELGGAKLDSLVAIVTRLKAKGVPIHGVGLQFHITYLTPTTGIDNALMKMAKLGLLVKISELDVSVNTGNQNDPNTRNFVLTPILLAQQAAKYKYVVESYYRNVPAAQRYGITVWGVSDKDSWLRQRLPYHTEDYPLLFDEKFNKKQAYVSFQEALQLK